MPLGNYVPLMYTEFYRLVSICCGQCSFAEYKRSYDECYEMPLDELELHTFARNAYSEKSYDDQKESMKE